MKVPLSWLREFASVKLPAQALAEKLTMAGIEVEQVIDRSKDFQDVLVGEVMEVRPHPNADRLRLASVVVKKGGKPLEIVCGAPNVSVGQKVAVAVLGARIPNGMSGITIEARKIRGIASQGMVCSERELGLGNDSAGIMVLESSLEVGTPFAQAMGFDDVVLDLAIPANRSDLLSIRGIAWEVAVITGSTFRGKAWTSPAHREAADSVGEGKPVGPASGAGFRPARFQVEPPTPVGGAPLEAKVQRKSALALKIENPRLCPLYIARVIRGIHVQQSPAWLQSRLRAAGIRPINAVVDATNAVMLEYGEPLHAFDTNKVQGGKIVIRSARSGESMTTLDGKRRTLDPSMLVIADANGPIALAGIMGGEHAEIGAATTNIILESAIFDPVSIRKTSRKLGLRSESSHRFEKGIAMSLPEAASGAAASLIVRMCGGTLEEKVAVGVRQSKPTVVKIAPRMFADLLGKPVAAAEAKRILIGLGFSVKGSASSWTVRVPEWRRDVSIAEDLVEEVGRMIGYNDVPDEPPVMDVLPLPIPELLRLKDEIRDVLVGFGFTETISHALYGEDSAQTVGGAHVAIANPLDKSQHMLRRSIIPQIQRILWHATDAGRDERVFEIGRVFISGNAERIERQQPWKLCVGMTFKPRSGYVLGRKTKGTIEGLLAALNVNPAPLFLETIGNPRSLMVQQSPEDAKTSIEKWGGVNPDRVKIAVEATTVKGRIAEWCELDLVELRDHRRQTTFHELPKFPAVLRDVSAWVPDSMQYQRVHDAIMHAGKPLLESIELFDVFEKDGKRSFAFHLTFRSAEKTLTDSEISATLEAITRKLRSLGAELR